MIAHLLRIGLMPEAATHTPGAVDAAHPLCGWRRGRFAPGHQAHVHKLLTGRQGAFGTLRQRGAQPARLITHAATVVDAERAPWRRPSPSR
jgi:hypothetical protein